MKFSRMARTTSFEPAPQIFTSTGSRCPNSPWCVPVWLFDSVDRNDSNKQQYTVGAAPKLQLSVAGIGTHRVYDGRIRVFDKQKGNVNRIDWLIAMCFGVDEKGTHRLQQKGGTTSWTRGSQKPPQFGRTKRWQRVLKSHPMGIYSNSCMVVELLSLRTVLCVLL